MRICATMNSDPDRQSHARRSRPPRSPSRASAGSGAPPDRAQQIGEAAADEARAATPITITSSTRLEQFARDLAGPRPRGRTRSGSGSPPRSRRRSGRSRRSAARPDEKGSGAGPPRSRARIISTSVSTASTRIGHRRDPVGHPFGRIVEQQPGGKRQRRQHERAEHHPAAEPGRRAIGKSRLAGQGLPLR